MAQGELLDLVCGPASPLPETYQRYRLVAHLGSGGQAEVYRAVRLSGGVSSAPMTVKVFRIDPKRPLADELRSWDKGDAVLMDLNNRGVTGICRRADGFYGPPPHPPGTPPTADTAVPYQVYDYLHGVNLREYVAQRASAPEGRRLNGVAALRTLAGILRALHHPTEAGATPVLHMDVKPSNVMVLPNGEVRLIDFTGARYWYAGEITQIAYTPESGGPEAFGGAAAVSPAYDVHGFGAVAYFMVTGTFPRGSSGEPAQPSAVLRRHPGLDSLPALRDHLHQPLADRPGDRPASIDLLNWLVRLSELVRRSGLPDTGIDWTEPSTSETVRAIGRAVARPAVTGTETGAFKRIERLERELVELRGSIRPAEGGQPAAASTTPASASAPTSAPAAGSAPLAAPTASSPPTAVSSSPPTAVAPAAPAPVSSPPTAVSSPAPTAVATSVAAGGLPAGKASMPAGKGSAPAGMASASAGKAAANPNAVRDNGGRRPGQPAAPLNRPHPTAAMPSDLVPNGVGRASAGPPAGFAAPSPGQSPSGQPAVDRAGQPVRGRAVVPPPKSRPEPMESGPIEPPPVGWQPLPGQRGEQIKRGLGMSVTSAIFAFLCWAVWAFDSRTHLGQPMVTFLVVIAVAVGVFALCRLLGRILIEQRLGRPRRGARVAHLVTSIFLIAAGVAFFRQAAWPSELMDSLSWLW